MRVSFVMLTLALALTGTPPVLAAAIPMAISTTVLSKNQCKFSTASAVLDFGNLDPTSLVPVTATASLTFVCRGSDPVAVYLIGDDNGLNAAGPDARRMQHTTLPGTFIAYGLSYTPDTGSAPRNVAQILNITGTLAPGSFATAPAGAYADTVVLTIAP